MTAPSPVHDERILHEQEHGKWVAEHGETVWNWSSPAGRYRWARRVALFRSFLADSGMKVLEVGCGTGLFTAEIAATGCRVTAIDISPDLLALARKRVTADNVCFVLEDAHATSFDSASFDAVIGSSCLHHLDIDKATKEFHRLLRPGGRLMFTEPNMLNPQIALQKNIPWLKRLAGDSRDETAFVRFLLERRLKRSGFTAISIVPFDFVHPAIPECVLPGLTPVLTGLESLPLLREIAGSLIISGAKP